MKHLSRHDDRPGRMLGLVYLWDEVPAALEYMKLDPSLTAAWWHTMPLQVGKDVAWADAVPHPNDPLGPVGDSAL